MGNIATNTMDAMTVSTELDVKTSFIKDCGADSLNYSTLDPLGNFRLKWPLYVAIPCLIVGIILLIVSSNSIKPVTSTPTNINASANTDTPINIVAPVSTKTVAPVSTKTIASESIEEKSTAKKIGTIAGWVFICISVLAGTYNGILYLFFYLPQYYKWFDGLSKDCKISVGKMGMIDALQAELRNNQPRRMNSYNYISI